MPHTPQRPKRPEFFYHPRRLPPQTIQLTPAETQPRNLRKETEAEFFRSMMFLLLATNGSFWSVALAQTKGWLPAILIAFVASFFWVKVIISGRRAGKLFTVAALCR